MAIRKAVRHVVGVSLLSLAMGVGAFPATVHAQAPSGAEPEAAGRDDIVVTATRTETLLSKTPIAVTALTGDQLSQDGISNPAQLNNVVPNVAIIRMTNGLQITIRGVTSTDTSEKGDPSAAFMLDGTYIARPQAQDVSFFDIERVEVLRGPQGTLWGRNTTAGAINVITATPKPEFQVSGDVMYENYNHVLATGVVNVPFGDAVALRAAVNYDRRDSYIESAGPFSLDPSRDNLSGRVTLLVKPTDSLKIVVRGDYASIKGVPIGSVPTSNFFTSVASGADLTPAYLDKPVKTQLTSPFGHPWQGSSDNWVRGISGQADWNLGDFTLTYLGSYRETHRRDKSDILGGTTKTTTDGDFWQNSQELRLAYNSGPLQVQVGGYYFKEHGDTYYFLVNPPASIKAAIGLPSFAVDYGFAQNPAISISKAAFGQATYALTPQLKLTGGIRYSSDDKSREGNTVINTLPGAGFPNNQFIVSVNDAHRKFSKTTWRVGLDYDVPDLGLIYANVSTGYKAGGFNDGCEAPSSGPTATCKLPAAALYYSPETLTAYEGGFKFRISPEFRLEGAIFHYDYNGLQLTSTTFVCGGPCAVTTNAGRSKVDGVELSAILRPAPEHRFDIQANFTNARYTDFDPVPGVSYAGRKLDRSPAASVTVGYTFDKQLGNGGDIAFSARTRFSSRYNLLALSNRVFFFQPAYTKTDLTLTYTAPDAHFYVGVFARNLENNITLTGATGGSSISAAAQFEDPRTYGVRAGFKF